MADLTPEQVQAVIWIVVGIIIIQGIWLAYLTYMIWKRKKKDENEVSKKTEAETGKSEKKE
jgi:ABC-type uncharacterized transport system permease subunit